MAASPDKVIWDATRLAAPHAQPDKARRVRAMFDAIAPTYERVNRVLSAGRDAAWRRKAVELAQISSDDVVLDLACGTGDFARAFASAGPACVVGADFSEAMLRLAVGRKKDRLFWCRADALSAPYSDGAFSVVSCAFGVRNFQSLLKGLKEMHRVLRPGGRAVILEFSLPRSRIARATYLFYFRCILPRVANLISGDRSGAYSYLPSSVEQFAGNDAMTSALIEAGFDRVTRHGLTLGVATVFVAWRS